MLEARDALLRVIVPTLSLKQFISSGKVLARALAVNRPTRPMQLFHLAHLLTTLG